MAPRAAEGTSPDTAAALAALIDAMESSTALGRHAQTLLLAGKLLPEALLEEALAEAEASASEAKALPRSGPVASGGGSGGAVGVFSQGLEDGGDGVRQGELRAQLGGQEVHEQHHHQQQQQQGQEAAPGVGAADAEEANVEAETEARVRAALEARRKQSERLASLALALHETYPAVAEALERWLTAGTGTGSTAENQYPNGMCASKRGPADLYVSDENDLSRDYTRSAAWDELRIAARAAELDWRDGGGAPLHAYLEGISSRRARVEARARQLVAWNEHPFRAFKADGSAAGVADLLLGRATRGGPKARSPLMMLNELLQTVGQSAADGRRVGGVEID